MGLLRRLKQFFSGCWSRNSSAGKHDGDGGIREEPGVSLDPSGFDREEIDTVMALSQSEHDHAIQEQDSSTDDALRIAQLEGQEKHRLEAQVKEDAKLAKDLLTQQVNKESPEEGNSKLSAQSTPQDVNPRTCHGCKTEIKEEKFHTLSGLDWHTYCFRCQECYTQTPELVLQSRGQIYHRICYQERKSCRRRSQRRKCIVCNESFSMGTEVKKHPYWKREFCPHHENDETALCCSCERLVPSDSEYIILDDGRKLCLECLDSAIMDTNECQSLYFDIRDYYESLNMRLKQEFPLYLVERQALNEAIKGERHANVHNVIETIGLCMSEEQTINYVLTGPQTREGNRLTGIETGNRNIPRQCEVTAILIIYGLPKLLTGSIVAHELMHAWFKLNGYPKLRPEVEEGMCQVMAHMWLESPKYSTPPVDTEAYSLSSSATPQKGGEPQFEKVLFEFSKYRIESDTSSIYGQGFRDMFRLVKNNGLEITLDSIRDDRKFHL